MVLRHTSRSASVERVRRPRAKALFTSDVEPAEASTAAATTAGTHAGVGDVAGDRDTPDARAPRPPRPPTRRCSLRAAARAPRRRPHGRAPGRCLAPCPGRCPRRSRPCLRAIMPVRFASGPQSARQRAAPRRRSDRSGRAARSERLRKRTWRWLAPMVTQRPRPSAIDSGEPDERPGAEVAVGLADVHGYSQRAPTSNGAVAARRRPRARVDARRSRRVLLGVGGPLGQPAVAPLGRRGAWPPATSRRPRSAGAGC